jgi:hypothetical protein
MSLRTIFGCTAACCLLLLCCAVPAHAQTLEWVRQLDTSEFEYSHDVSADGLGGVYISGYTWGDLDGTNAGSWDAFVSKYDAGGELQWTRQLGTSEFEYGSDVSAVYIASVEFDADGIPSLSGTPIVLLDDIDTFLSTIFV